MWWRLYDDPVLDRLMTKALTRNTDLRVALSTLEQAQALLREAELARTPSTVLTSDPIYGKSPGSNKSSASFNVNESISYNLDLFGQLRRSIEESRASTASALAALDLARINVASDTASAYASVCSAGFQIGVTNSSIAIARSILDVTERRFRAGLVGSNDVVSARTLLRQTLATLPALVTRQHTGLYMLATLTGDPPEAFPAEVASCVVPVRVRGPIAVDNAATLLARRPDVRQAERNLASSVAAIGVVTADLYPSVRLGADFGSSATTVGKLIRSKSFQWSIGPMVTWTFPNVSIVRAEIAAANASAEGLLATFDGKVLTALRETENALVTLSRRLETELELTEARNDAALALSNYQRLYAGGTGAFLTVLTAEQTLISAQLTLAQTTVQVSNDQISLFLALGGGWEEAPTIRAVRGTLDSREDRTGSMPADDSGSVPAASPAGGRSIGTR